MEALLTGDSMTGAEAVEAGFANRAFPADRLEAEVLDVAERVAQIPGDLLDPQQAHGAPRDGGAGHAHRPARDHRAPGARPAPTIVEGVHAEAALRRA